MTHKEIAVEFRGEAQQVAVIRLMRSSKRNALSDGLILGLRDVFLNLPASVRAAVVDGDGPHFCAGLDLSFTPRKPPAGSSGFPWLADVSRGTSMV